MGADISKGTIEAGTLVEQEDSPQWSYGDNIECTRTWRGPMAACLAARKPKGYIATAGDAPFSQSTGGGWMIVSSCTVRAQERGIGLLTFVFGGGKPGDSGNPPADSLLPADEYKLELTQIEHDVRKHPRYDTVFDMTTDTGRKRLQDIDAILHSKEDEIPTTAKYIYTAGAGYDATVHECFKKLRRGGGSLTYALWTPVLRRTTHHWNPPTDCTVGGFRETPDTGGLFSLPTGYEWLRAGDGLEFNGSYWQKTSQWIAAPVWDHDLYADGP